VVKNFKWLLAEKYFSLVNRVQVKNNQHGNITPKFVLLLN